MLREFCCGRFLFQGWHGGWANFTSALPGIGWLRARGFSRIEFVVAVLLNGAMAVWLTTTNRSILMISVSRCPEACGKDQGEAAGTDGPLDDAPLSVRLLVHPRSMRRQGMR